jgi:hypothetical protein
LEFNIKYFATQKNVLENIFIGYQKKIKNDLTGQLPLHKEFAFHLKLNSIASSWLNKS